MRTLEVNISKHSEEEFDKILSHEDILDGWGYHSDNEQTNYKVLIQDDDAKELLQRLEKRSIHRVVIYPVEGTLPKVKDPVDHSSKKIRMGKFITLSKEELYHDIDKPVSLSVNYFLKIILSSFVAGIGILKNNVAILSGQGSTLLGVMVAAALLPPLIRSGLLIDGADYKNALNSFLIFSANIVCLNIAGIITFYLSGIRPRRWWEKEDAKKKTRSAFVIWTLALLFLIIVIMLLSKIR